MVCWHTSHRVNGPSHATHWICHKVQHLAALGIVLWNALEYSKGSWGLQGLSDWLKKFHILYATSSDPPLLSQVQRLKASERPDQDSAYWAVLQRVAALGWIQETYDLLTSHSVFTTSYTEQQQNPNLKAEVAPL